ncbi:MAG TPA: GntG family PLP-dependent aldolase [Acidimicrobiia bacterium]|nr:GntG family PLP-dependent aldolase [Acidimicrobiia bacterium]
MAFPDGTADFRSDTVTRPTEEMRRAMAEAEVGDDVYGDDPTVNLLQEEAAAVVGKEAGIFVPTGTMGNQLSVMAQTRPGDDVLCDEGAHVRNVEKGAAAAFSGVSFRPVHAPGGWIQPGQIDAVMATAGRFFPRVRLMVWENSHNMSGGRVTPVDGMNDGIAAARRHGLRIHLDGARIFNAAAALGVGADEIAAGADTVTFCFSKGLGAPVGSIVCADRDTIDELHYLRKRMGGGMRQVGVLAAPARIALRDRDRVADDNALAAHLAERLADHAPDAVDRQAVQTNIVNVAIEHLPFPIDRALESVRRDGILVNPPLFGGVWRLVTHRDVDRADVDRLVSTLFRSAQ